MKLLDQYSEDITALSVEGNISLLGNNMTENRLLQEGKRVEIHSLGPYYPDRFCCLGTIVGISVNDVTKIYIVQLDNPSDMHSNYSCVTIPEACLRVV